MPSCLRSPRSGHDRQFRLGKISHRRRLRLSLLMALCALQRASQLATAAPPGGVPFIVSYRSLPLKLLFADEKEGRALYEWREFHEAPGGRSPPQIDHPED